MLPKIRLPPPKIDVDRPSLTASSSYSVALVSMVKLFGMPFMIMSIMAACERSSVLTMRIWQPFSKVVVFILKFFLA